MRVGERAHTVHSSCDVFCEPRWARMQQPSPRPRAATTGTSATRSTCSCSRGRRSAQASACVRRAAPRCVPFLPFSFVPFAPRQNQGLLAFRVEHLPVECRSLGISCSIVRPCGGLPACWDASRAPCHLLRLHNGLKACCFPVVSVSAPCSSDSTCHDELSSGG